MKPPSCERKGTLPHPATCVLVWDLLSGRVVRYLCDDHALDARPRPYRLAKMIDTFEQADENTEEI
jgi:hypothetical protein